MKSKFFRYIVYLLLAGTLLSCSPQKRLNNKQKRVERFARKHNLTMVDTIHIQDTITVVTNKVEKDTVVSFETFRSDTLIITKENLTVKTIYDSHTDSVYVFGECDSDTIYQPYEIKVPVEKTVIKESEFDWWKILTSIILVAMIILILLRKKAR